MNEGGPKRVEKDTGAAMESSWRETIEELEEPLARILEDLRPELEKGSYKVVLGDDASGRIPALILAKAIAEIYKVRNYDKPLVRFIAGGKQYRGVVRREDLKEDLRNHLQRVGEDAGILNAGTFSQIKTWLSHISGKDKKILIVTDVVTTGKPLQFFVENLLENNIPVDTATVAIRSDQSEEEIINTVGTRVFSGDTKGSNSPVPKIWSKSELSGVSKTRLDLFAYPTKRDVDDKKQSQEATNFARKVANEVAERLVSRYAQEEEWEKRKAA